MGKSWKFTHVAGLAMGVSIVAHIYQFTSTGNGPFLIIVNGVLLAMLAFAAVRAHEQRAPGFDVIVAAETIVAFGVMSLIFSLAAALAPLFTGARQLDVNSIKSLQSSALPFLEGLATAGVAPLVAMLVRNLAVEKDALANPTGDVTDLAQALGALTSEVRQAHSAIGELGSAVAAAVRSTTGFAEAVKEEANGLAVALGAAEARVRSLGEATSGGADQVASLRAELEQLTTSSTGARTMLDTLAQVIESVERFIAPATRTGTR